MENRLKQKLNWRKVIDEIPEVSDILRTGDIDWINATETYEEGEIIRSEASFVENFSSSNLSYDTNHIIEDQDEKVLKAIQIMQVGIQNLKEAEKQQI
jgi:hypothetical protein